MRYLIDGYNLLFKTAWMHQHNSLEAARNRLMLELDSDARLLNISISIVFDAPFQSDALSRGHFNSLEIIFTARGETADQFLIQWVQELLPSKNITVVTSDKPLTRHVRSLGVNVESVADFLARLHKRKLNKEKRKDNLPAKKREVKKEQPKVVSPPIAIPELEPEPIIQKKGSKKNELPPLSDLAAWEILFTTKDRKKHTKW